MSGQWEIVAKKKDKGNKDFNQKIGQQISKKKKAENLNVKVEDVLAKSQVKNLYFNDKNRENKPVDSKKNIEPVGVKKNQKKQEKTIEVPKPKAPKTLESALKQIDVKEFRDIFERSKSQFPEAPIIWLKELVQFLNQRTNIESEDPAFTAKPQGFPLIVVPSELKSLIEKVFEEIDHSTLLLFFDVSLTSMATDMNKGLPATGHKLFLQYIALNNPNVVISNLAKYCSLRTSYQNQPNIGISILWSVGQAGIKDLQAGIAVFQDLMLPLIEQKNYSRYIVKYLIDIILTQKQQSSITKEQYIFILEIIFSNNKRFPNDLRQDLLAIIPRLKPFLFFDCKKDLCKNYVEFYLKKIGTIENLVYQENICDLIVECFIRDSNTLELWSKSFPKNVTSSALLLKYLESHWQPIYIKMNQKMLGQTLQQIADSSKDLMLQKKKSNGLTDAIHITQKLLEKMTKKTSHSFFKLFLFTACLIISGLIYCDVSQQGGWQKSKINGFLKDSGICSYTHQIKDGIQHVLFIIDEQIEQKCPTCKRTVVEFSEPYVELFINLGRVCNNIYYDIKEVALERYPALLHSVETYAPGLMEQSQNAVNNVWTSSVFYFNRSVTFLKKEVFVGQLSPENVQKVMYEAFNTTQNKATEYYHWLYEKVQNTIS